MKRISVIGLGYVGLPTAILAAQGGYEVLGFDTNREKIKCINNGDATIIEPEITERLWKVLKNGTFHALPEPQYADCFVIAVPTPFKNEKQADLSYVFDAAQTVARYLMPGNLVILESTVPVGTTEKLAMLLEEHSGLKMGIDFFVAHCPERVLPGKIFKELMENDRVIGGICQRSCELASIFYSKFIKGFLHMTDDKTAEMVKLVENSYRDVQIAFANQLASMCGQAGLDPFQVIDIANKHPRIKILSPGCGVGGHCIAVDPWFLIESFPEQTGLLQTARHINDNKPLEIIKLVREKIDDLLELGVTKPNILALGLTFKPNVDDIRESPALKIATELGQETERYTFQAYDHNIHSHNIGNIKFNLISDLWEGIAWADLVVILVKHKEFSLIHEENLENKVVIDACGLMYELQSKKKGSLLEGAVRTTCSLESNPF